MTVLVNGVQMSGNSSSTPSINFTFIPTACSKTNLHWQEVRCGRLNISKLGDLSWPVSMGAAASPLHTWAAEDGKKKPAQGFIGPTAQSNYQVEVQECIWKHALHCELSSHKHTWSSAVERHLRNSNWQTTFYFSITPCTAVKATGIRIMPVTYTPRMTSTDCVFAP